MSGAGEAASQHALRIGIVGLGWAGRQHLEACSRNPHVDVAAVADVDERRIAEARAAFGVPFGVTDWRMLVDPDRVDAVSIATPNELHAPVAVAALSAGLHVLTEKPMARSAAEAEAMRAAARTSGRVLMVNFNYRARGGVHTLRSWLGAGELGRVYHAKASWRRRRGIPGLGNWFTSRRLAGGGALIDIGIHVLDMALYLMDEPEVRAVSAMTYSEHGPRARGVSARTSKRAVVHDDFDVEDSAIALLRLADRASITLDASWAEFSGVGDEIRVALLGTEGGAEISVREYADRDTLHIYKDIEGHRTAITPELPPDEDYDGVLRDFVSAILGGDWSRHDGSEGVRRAEVLDACYQSAAEQREIVLDHWNPSAGV